MTPLPPNKKRILLLAFERIQCCCYRPALALPGRQYSMPGLEDWQLSPLAATCLDLPSNDGNGRAGILIWALVRPPGKMKLLVCSKDGPTLLDIRISVFVKGNATIKCPRRFMKGCWEQPGQNWELWKSKMGGWTLLQARKSWKLEFFDLGEWRSSSTKKYVRPRTWRWK